MGLRQGAFSADAGTAAEGTSGALPNASDSELLAGIGRQETSCLSELLHRYWRPIAGYAAAFVDADSAEDVAQETFLRVSAGASRWRPLGPVRGWLFHIARNIALNERRRQRNSVSMLASARAVLARRSAPTPGELLEERETGDAIRRALEAMPERRREVFALIRFGGLSYHEAATLLGTSDQTVANQMSTAMAELRRAVEPFAGDPD